MQQVQNTYNNDVVRFDAEIRQLPQLIDGLNQQQSELRRNNIDITDFETEQLQELKNKFSKCSQLVQDVVRVTEECSRSQQQLHRGMEQFNQQIVRVIENGSRAQERLLQKTDNFTYEMLLYKLRTSLNISGSVNGLTNDRIKQFEHFFADELLFGQQCQACFNDVQVGMQMVRLDCCQYVMCKVCTETWFANNVSCPACRIVFA